MCLCQEALGHVGRVIATTFESLEILRERYSEIDETIAVLEKHFAEVHHASCQQMDGSRLWKGDVLSGTWFSAISRAFRRSTARG